MGALSKARSGSEQNAPASATQRRGRMGLAVLLLSLLATACSDEQADPQPEVAVAPLAGELLIEELYYSGALPYAGTSHYFSDQFVELVNASDHPLDLSAVMIGDAYGAAGAINPGMQPDSYRDARPDDVVLSSVWRIPAGVRMEPGERLVIAHDGTNHRPFSTVDLSGAAFETYVATSGGDDDHPTVSALEPVVFNGGYDWLLPVFGPSVVVLSANASLGVEPSQVGDLATVPASAVLDGIECLMDDTSGAFKRLPDSVDTGFAWVSGVYVGESLHRQRVNGVWMDSNDSGADFVVRPPDPTMVNTTEEGVFGNPWVELGTGRTTFAPLVDGGVAELVVGIQGGWHIDASLRFGGFGPDGAIVIYEAVDAQAQPVSFVTQAALSSASVLPEDEGWVRVGDRIVLDISDPNEVVGKTLVLRATAVLGEQTWSDERSVTIVDEQ